MTITTIVYKGLLNAENIIATCEGDALFERDAFKAALLSHGICPDEAKQEYLDALEFMQEKAPT